MIVRETKDVSEIKAILCSPIIYDTISDDNSGPIDEFEPELLEHSYIAGYVDGEIIGLMVYHQHEEQNLCHVQVLKTHRAKHARKFGEASLVFKPDGPLYAIIPSCYENVLSFADMFNFRPIDKRQGTYIKGGIAYDDIILKHEERSWDS